MSKHSISEAARLVGKSRTTLYRHIKAGKITVEEDDGGNSVVDTSELTRVYGALQGVPDGTPHATVEQEATGVLERENELLRRENELLRQRLADKEEHIEDLRRTVEDHRRLLTGGEVSQAPAGGVLRRWFRRGG